MSIEPIEVPPAPPCFESGAQWRAWHEIASSCQMAYPGIDSYCADCTPEWQRQMIAEGRCAHPTVSFVTNNGEPCDGRRQGSPRQRRAIAIAELGFDPSIRKQRVKQA